MLEVTVLSDVCAGFEQCTGESRGVASKASGYHQARRNGLIFMRVMVVKEAMR